MVEEWQLVRLGEVVTTSQGGTPRKNEADYWNGQIPFLTGADLTEFRLSRKHARSFLTTEGLHSGQTVVCEPGSLLLATRTRVGLAGLTTEIMGASQDITRLTPSDEVRSGYLCRYLLREAAALQRKSRGTTIKGITKDELQSIAILLPPLPEQRAITTILDSIDQAIEATDALISATEQLRDSLLHNLLTRGLPGRHTEWKQVPGLGAIPADWHTARLGDVATLQRGMDLPEGKRNPGSVPVYGSNGVHGFHNESPVEGPGVVTGRSGSIGRIYYSDSSFWPLNTTLFVKDFHGNDRRFAYYFLSSLHLERFAASTGVPSLNRNFVHPLTVAVPPLPEQQAISTILDSVDESIGKEREAREGLRKLKESASDALLTGRVRVSVRDNAD